MIITFTCVFQIQQNAKYNLITVQNADNLYWAYDDVKASTQMSYFESQCLHSITVFKII